MILDRTWNKYDQRLTITYLDKNAKRQTWQKYLHHIKTYEYDENGKYETWNHKRANRIFKDSTKYSPNEFDILEFLYELKDNPDTADFYKDISTSYPIRVYAYDIETSVVDGIFPDPETAPNEVTSISLCGPDLSCMVLGLHDLNSEQIALMEQRYLSWLETNTYANNLIKHQNFKPKFYYQYFKNEQELLTHWFTKILPQIPILVGWNNYRFDKQYLCNRIIKLFGERKAKQMIKAASVTNEMKKIEWEEPDHSKHFTYCATHQAEFDYIELVKKYDKKTTYENYTLDWVGSTLVGAHKIKYDGTLQQLYEKDPEWYYYYNAIDSVIVELIHYHRRCVEPVANASSLTLVPMMKSMGYVALTNAGIFEMFYKDDKKVVWDWDEVERVKKDYKGAYVGCIPGRFDFSLCDDFGSLYPSQYITCNMSVENIIYKYSEPDSLGRRIVVPWDADEIAQFKQDPNYFVSLNNNVYRNDKDYAFKKFQLDKKILRDQFKYLGQDIDSELISQIEHRISELEKLSA